MALKTVIFDFDDTLVSSTKHHIESFKRAISKYNLSINEKKIIKLFGKPVTQILEETFPNLSKSKLDKIKEEKEKNYKKIIRDKKPKPLKGAKNILEYLYKSNFKIGVLSSDSITNIRLVLKANKISGYFDNVIGSENIKTHKPHPDGLLKIAKQMKSQVQNCLYVGDSKYDMMAAASAKMIGVGIATGHYSKTSLKFYGACIVFNNLEEMLAYIKEKKILNSYGFGF